VAKRGASRGQLLEKKDDERLGLTVDWMMVCGLLVSDSPEMEGKAKSAGNRL
jgi:hypothetical protein